VAQPGVHETLTELTNQLAQGLLDAARDAGIPPWRSGYRRGYRPDKPGRWGPERPSPRDGRRKRLPLSEVAQPGVHETLTELTNQLAQGLLDAARDAGIRYTPSSSIRWKKRLKRSTSHFTTS
jgi:hypothetical protein